MNISEAARASGLSVDTIRFYERREVLPRPPRTANGYRSYTSEHIATLSLAARLRELDLPLDELSAIVRVAHDATCGELRDVLTGTVEGALGRIDERIAGLRQTRTSLATLRRGLDRMTPDSEQVAGLAPCECVQMVGELPRVRA